MSIQPSIGPNVPPLYFVEVDYGKIGMAFVETDRNENSRASLINDIASGQYDRGRIIKVLEIFEDEGTCRDVTEDIQIAVRQHLYEHSDHIPESLRDWISEVDGVSA